MQGCPDMTGIPGDACKRIPTRKSRGICKTPDAMVGLSSARGAAPNPIRKLVMVADGRGGEGPNLEKWPCHLLCLSSPSLY